VGKFRVFEKTDQGETDKHSSGAGNGRILREKAWEKSAVVC